MNLYSIPRGFGLALAALWMPSATAQPVPKKPHLAYVFPAGCQQGQTCEVVVGGQYLKSIESAAITGEGVTVEVVSYYQPLTDGQFNSLRRTLDTIRDRLTKQREAKGLNGKPPEEEVIKEAGFTDEQLEQMELYRQRRRDPRRQPNEQLDEQIRVKVTVADNADVGKRQLRLAKDPLVSDPIWFHIDRYTEVVEHEPNDDDPEYLSRSMPLNINGQIFPGDRDRFSFDVRRGQNLVIKASVRDVIPYLADAVPGWFQAVMDLRDSDGNEVAYSDSFFFHQDPVMMHRVSRDDTYTLTIRDSVYRGREDFVYRVTVGEIPFVTDYFPLGATADSDVTVRLRGWNLTNTTATIKTKSRRNIDGPQVFTVRQNDGTKVSLPLRVDLWPDVDEAESNDSPDEAQPIKLRTAINGRIDRPGDVDMYRLPGGGRITAEVYARRLGSPLDSVLSVLDAEGNVLAFADDFEDRSHGLLTHQADSHLEVSLPAGGPYYLRLMDTQRNGGPEYAYRLCLRAPESSFQLRVTPGTIAARPGQVVPIDVHVMRTDGFDQPIQLQLVDPPEGLVLNGGIIPPGSDRVTATLTMPAKPDAKSVSLHMKGIAARRGRGRTNVESVAVACEDRMQAFIWHHLIPLDQWSLVMTGKRTGWIPFRVQVPPGQPLPLAVKGKVTVPAVMHQKNVQPSQITLEPVDAPEGIAASLVDTGRGQLGLEVDTTACDLTDGDAGNLVFRVIREIMPPKTEANPNPKIRRQDIGLYPAVPFEVSKSRTRPQRRVASRN
ncbi:peptidase [Crateriforma conspicua]|uniref:peptidase n=1 Tax=Crateriforma conspicua TaxID=2527996 RepID=UPI00118B8539|nr:peptidase [Crateriforma conspicua]QDV64921.1 putative subtilase-type serine protease precursor [Crateriforma conspicua]